ncbi:hypothetical protein Bca101_020192 [Brassica carinata]
MNNHPDLPTFPTSFVGGRTRPRRLFANPFSSSIPTWGEVLEAADREAVLMAPLKQRCFHLLDNDYLCSKIWEEELADIRRKYLIPPSVEMRGLSELERAPDGGTNEVAIFKAYLEAGFRGGILSLIAEVSAYFGFSHCQLTPLTWRTLIAMQVLGEFMASLSECMRSCTPTTSPLS